MSRPSPLPGHQLRVLPPRGIPVGTLRSATPRRVILQAYSSTVKAMLIFDGDCGFCTASVVAVRRLVRPRCEIAPWQQTSIAPLGISVEECMAAVQFIDQDGSVTSGSRAVMAMLRTAPQPWPLIGLVGDLPGIAWVAAKAYRWVAANRYRLPGSTPACELAAA